MKFPCDWIILPSEITLAELMNKQSNVNAYLNNCKTCAHKIIS
jgi:hypothetical protein